MNTRHLLRCLLVLPVALLALAPVPTRAAPRAAGTWTVTGSMHEARGFQTTTLLPNGQVLEAGGFGANGWLASAELYHPHTGSWASTGSMYEARGQFTATLLRDGQVLAVGGAGTNDASSAELYNPQTGKWTLTGFMHEPRVFHTATLLADGRVLVAGGTKGDCNNGICPPILARAELYDPRTGKWTMTGSMRQARARQTATLLPSGLVLVAGGFAGDAAGDQDVNPLASAELYDPSTGKWTLTGSMHEARAHQAATLLPNGLVLVDGGGGANGSIRNAELYHPRTGTWTVTGSLHDPRDYETGETAVLLRNGQVLVLGGGTASAELYNPRTGTWTVTGSLHAARNAQPETLLASGQVLVAGGSLNNGGSSLASAELYNP